MSVDKKVNTAYNNRYRDEEEEVELDLRGNPILKDETIVSDEDNSQNEQSDENLSAEELTFKKRYGDLRSHSQKREQQLQKEFEDRLAAKEEELRKFKEAVSPKSDTELEEFKTEYPDLADVIESMSRKQAKELTKHLEEEIKSLKKNSKELEKEKVHNLIRKEHSDWDELKDDSNFHEWLLEQPKEIQNWMFGKIDADLASKAIKLYKTEKGIKTKKPSSDGRASAAEAVITNKRTDPPEANSRSKKIWKASEIEKMSGPEWDKHEDEILLANSEGRIDNNA